MTTGVPFINLLPLRGGFPNIAGLKGKSHPNVAIALNNLAQLLQATNRLAEAEPLMERVVSIFEIS